MRLCIGISPTSTRESGQRPFVRSRRFSVRHCRLPHARIRNGGILATVRIPKRVPGWLQGGNPRSSIYGQRQWCSGVARSSAHRSSTPANRPNRVIAPVSSTDTKASSARASPPFWRKLWREYWQDILGTGEAAPPAVIPAQAGIQRASEVRQLTISAHRKIPNKSRLPL